MQSTVALLLVLSDCSTCSYQLGSLPQVQRSLNAQISIVVLCGVLRLVVVNFLSSPTTFSEQCEGTSVLLHIPYRNSKQFG